LAFNASQQQLRTSLKYWSYYIGGDKTYFLLHAERTLSSHQTSKDISPKAMHKFGRWNLERISPFSLFDNVKWHFIILRDTSTMYRMYRML